MLYARRVIALHDGAVAADGPPQEALSPALVQTLYGIEAHFFPTPDGLLISPAKSE